MSDLKVVQAAPPVGLKARPQCYWTAQIAGSKSVIARREGESTKIHITSVTPLTGSDCATMDPAIMIVLAQKALMNAVYTDLPCNGINYERVHVYRALCWNLQDELSHEFDPCTMTNWEESCEY